MDRKKYIIFILFIFLIFNTGCNNNTVSKAEKIYKEKGLDEYTEFVENEKIYYQFHDLDDNGATPLLVAIKRNNIVSISTFIKYGASVYTEKDKEGKDTFDYLKEKTPNEVKQILSVIPSDYWYLENNIKRLLENEKNYSMLCTLVEDNKFSPDYVIEKGKTILMYAAQHITDIRYITLLSEKSTDINKINDNEWNSVMYAARYNPNPAILECLMKRNADTDRNSAGISLTMLAACNPNPGVLLCIPTTEKYMHKTTVNGKTALMYACENNRSVDIIEILCRDFKEDINVVDSEGKTALMYALMNNTDTEVCEYLLKSGAIVDLTDNSGKSTLNYLENNTNLNDLINSIYFQGKKEEIEN